MYFGSGTSPAKDELTAHELTHVVQQTGGKQLNRQIMRRQVPELEDKIDTPTTEDQEKTQQTPNQKQQPLQETGTEKQNNNNLLSESKGKSTQPQQQLAENSNAVEGEQSPQTQEKKNKPKNPEQDLQQNKQVNQQSTELKENNEITKNFQGKDNKQEINNQAEKENQQEINNAGEKENNKDGANSRSDLPINHLAPTDAVTNNVGVEGAGKTNQIPQQATELNTEDPGKIIEQLKNTPPTQAFAAYAEVQNALPQAFEKQRQQVQTTIPEIPAPVGLSPNQEASQKAPLKLKKAPQQEQHDPKLQKEKPDTEKEQHDPKPQKEEPKSEDKKGKKGQEDKKVKRVKRVKISTLAPEIAQKLICRDRLTHYK
ncbi:DUF4157 domain-containing protein [Nostoc sp. FACHB-888]|nr:DUF4157 domain-containing protein [Nostoc sp. FACHB-888]